MKILQQIGSLTGGGAEKVASNLSKILNNNNYEISTLISNFSDKDYEHSGKIIVFDSNFKIKIFKFFDKCIKLKKMKRIENYDFTISHNITGYIYNILTSIDEKNIFYVHTNLPYSFAHKNLFIKKSLKFIFKFFFSKADYIVAVSEGVKDSLINEYNISTDKIITIYNAFDIKKIRLMARNSTIDERIFNKRNILAIGRLVSIKNHELIISLFEQIHSKFQDVNLIILGSGSEKNKLLELIKNRNLQDCVILIDFESNPYKYIQKCDLVTLASDYEGLSNVLVEAFILKKPILALDTKFGPREILTNSKNYENSFYFESDYGFLIESIYKKVDKHFKIFPKSKEQYIEKALLTLNKPNFYQISDKYEKNLIKFSLKHFKSQWISLFNRLKNTNS